MTREVLAFAGSADLARRRLGGTSRAPTPHRGGMDEAGARLDGVPGRHRPKHALRMALASALCAVGVATTAPAWSMTLRAAASARQLS